MKIWTELGRMVWFWIKNTEIWYVIKDTDGKVDFLKYTMIFGHGVSLLPSRAIPGDRFHVEVSASGPNSSQSPTSYRNIPKVPPTGKNPGSLTRSQLSVRNVSVTASARTVLVHPVRRFIWFAGSSGLSSWAVGQVPEFLWFPGFSRISSFPGFPVF